MRFRVSTSGNTWTYNLDSPIALQANVRRFYIFSFNRIDGLMQVWVGDDAGTALQTASIPITGVVANNYSSWSANLTLGAYLYSDRVEQNPSMRWAGNYDSVFYLSSPMSADLATFLYNGGAGRKYSQMAGAPQPLAFTPPPGSGTLQDPWIPSSKSWNIFSFDHVSKGSVDFDGFLP
jgi:hypothetical protein